VYSSDVRVLVLVPVPLRHVCRHLPDEIDRPCTVSTRGDDSRQRRQHANAPIKRAPVSPTALWQARQSTVAVSQCANLIVIRAMCVNLRPDIEQPRGQHA
jgi:hypothetical protein